MGAQGVTTVDFGAFPGVTDVSLFVSQAGILSGSAVGAWLMPAATADHSIDEHWVDGPVIFAGNIAAGSGFTIYAVTAPYPNPPDQTAQQDNIGNLADQISRPLVRATPRVYGLWTVAWCWN